MKGCGNFISVHFLKLAYIDVYIHIYMKEKTMDYVYIALYNLGRVSIITCSASVFEMTMWFSIK